MPLGVDLSDHQTAVVKGHRIPLQLADFQRLVAHGKVFAIIKASQYIAEQRYPDYSQCAREAGLMRGAYHLFTERPVADQAQLFLDIVARLGPGELPPTLDVEDPDNAQLHLPLFSHYGYTHDKKGTPAGTRALLDALQAWLDRVEAALGRTPIIYTGVIWRDDLSSARMSQYPLWTLPNRFRSDGWLGGWRRAELWQYAEDGGPWFGKEHYREPGVELPGVDYDAYNGTIYGLRGLADLGRTGVGLTTLGTVVAHCEPDRHLHLVRESSPQTWTDADLMDGALPGLGGDPVLCTAGSAVRLYFRSDGRIVEATQADPAATWDVEDLSSVAGATAVHDPRVLTVGDRRMVVFWGDDDDWHLLTRTASTPWIATRLLSAAHRSGAAGVPPSSGQPAIYLVPGSADLRIVGRAGPVGHLVELALGPAGWAATDLTATSAAQHGIPPAATYSPTVYHSDVETFVVYRAVRGELWQIARGARQATNLTSAAAGSAIAVGHPTCFVRAGQVHVIYRGVDQLIHELTGRNGNWSAARLPCDVPAASDPTCPDGGTGLVAFRATDGMVRVLQFDGFIWTCADTIRPAAPPSAGLARSRPAAPLAVERSDEVTPEAPESLSELSSTRGQWLRAVTTAHLDSGTAADSVHEGIGAIVGEVKGTVAGAFTGAAGVLARAGALNFDDFIHRIDEMERLATTDGYALTQRVTAFRKVFYDSTAGRGSYPGVSTGGGVWNILIPGAAATPLPPSWRTPPAAGQVADLRSRKEQIINGVHVDIGHVLAGLDARNHPTDINLSVLGFPLLRMRSNVEATTFTGDLGSVVVKYLYGSNRSFQDTAMEIVPTLLNDMYNASAEADMSGNADAHLMALEPARSLAENLRAYYIAATGGWRRRWQGFVVTIGLGTFTPAPAAMGTYLQSHVIGTFSGSTERWHADMQGEVMNAALAYAAATGHRSDLVNVYADLGPGIVTPTFWEMYWHASGWVLDEFLRRLKAAVRDEQAGRTIP